jgi:hypothetical protein
MNAHFLVALTTNEYQILCRGGELRADPWRLVAVPKRWREEKSACEFAGGSLAERLPELDPEEMHSVLIAEFSERSYPVIDNVPDGRVWLRIDHCLRIFPIDSSSEPIVASRVGELGISLDRPVLASSLTPAVDRISHRWSIFGGQALVKAVSGVEGYAPSWVDPANIAKPEVLGQIVHHCLKYSRHKPWGPEPLSAIKDLGLILKDAGGEGGDRSCALDLLRGICKTNEGSNRGLGLLLRDRHLPDTFAAIQSGWSLPLDPAALVLLLHWLYQGQRADGVDIGAVLGDCEEVRDVLYHDVVCDALWLLGFKAQFGSFSKDWLTRLGPGQEKGNRGKTHRFVQLKERPDPELTLEHGTEKAVVGVAPGAPQEESPEATLEGKGDSTNDITETDGTTSPEDSLEADSEGGSFPASEPPQEESPEATLEAKVDSKNDIMETSGTTSSEDSTEADSEGISFPASEPPKEEAAEGCKEDNEDLNRITIDPSVPLGGGKRATKKTEKKETPASEKSGAESGELI